MIDAGHYALAIAFVATSWSVVAAILASLEHRETLQRSAERALYGAAALISFATFVLVRGFVMDDFDSITSTATPARARDCPTKSARCGAASPEACCSGCCCWH